MKNSFMNALYQDGIGKTVTGWYMGSAFEGVITNVRCTYGNDLNVYVDLTSQIQVGNSSRNSLVLSGSELAEGHSSVTNNLHVYF